MKFTQIKKGSKIYKSEDGKYTIRHSVGGSTRWGVYSEWIVIRNDRFEYGGNKTLKAAKQAIADGRI